MKNSRKVDKPPEKEKRYLKFFTGDNAPPVRPIQWIIKGLLARKAITVLAGQPGVSKSVHSFILAACLSLGKNFLDFEVTQPYNVLYLDIDAEWGWSSENIAAVFRGLGIEGTVKNFAYWSPLNEECYIPGQPTNLEELGTDLEDTVKDFGFDLIVIDSLNQFMKGDPNKSQDVVTALRHSLLGVRRAGASVLILDHTNKADRSGKSDYVPMASGSQQKRGAARLTVALEEEGDMIRWSVDKANNAKFVPFLTRLEFVKYQGQTHIIRAIKEGEAVARELKKLTKTMERILDLLHLAGGEVKREEFGRGGSVDKDLKILIKHGFIEQPRYGYYQLKQTTSPTSPDYFT